MNVLMLTNTFIKNSNSNILAQAVAKGAIQQGHTIKTLNITHLEIIPCHNCGYCEAPRYRSCTLKDGMKFVSPHVLSADTVLFVFPLYWNSISKQMKQCIDRFKGIAPDPAHNPLKGKNFGAVFSFAHKDALVYGCANTIKTLQDMSTYAEANWKGAVYAKTFKLKDMAANQPALEEAFAFGVAL